MVGSAHPPDTPAQRIFKNALALEEVIREITTVLYIGTGLCGIRKKTGPQPNSCGARTVMVVVVVVVLVMVMPQWQCRVMAMATAMAR